MEDQTNATRYLESIINIYKYSGAPTRWAIFWEKYHSKRLSFQENDLSDFITARCQEISHFLAFLDKDNPVVKKFFTELPLRLSKVIFDWPPTPEQVKELMTD